MAPPTPIHPASTLPTQINLLPSPTGNATKPRKPPIASLDACPLKEMLQYKCNIEKAKRKGAQPLIVCEPVVRLFRVCGDGLHVETTAWEGEGRL